MCYACRGFKEVMDAAPLRTVSSNQKTKKLYQETKEEVTYSR